MVCKAKSFDGKLWITGYYNELDGEGYIESLERNTSSRIKVKPDTVMRRTDFKTASNQAIFEKDIVEYKNCKSTSSEAVIETGVIKWSDSEGEWIIAELESGIKKDYLKNVAQNPKADIEIKVENH